MHPFVCMCSSSRCTRPPPCTSPNFPSLAHFKSLYFSPKSPSPHPCTPLPSHVHLPPCMCPRFPSPPHSSLSLPPESPSPHLCAPLPSYTRPPTSVVPSPTMCAPMMALPILEPFVPPTLKLCVLPLRDHPI
jgi:hypothetical protein